MYLPIAGLCLGLFVGSLIPGTVPVEYAKYMSIALLACLDTVFGGLRAGADEKFDNSVFVTGFFTNALMAAGLSHYWPLVCGYFKIWRYYAAIF